MYNVYNGLDMKKGLITVREVAKLFDVSAQTVRRWDQKGRLKAQRHPMNNYRVYRLVELKKIAQKLE